MVLIDLYVCEGSNTVELIGKKSSSGETLISNIIFTKIESPDDLLFEVVNRSDRNNYSIILYNNMRTLLEPIQIIDFIEELTKNINYDLFYLNKFADDCRTHEEFKIVKNVETMRVFSPHSIKGLIISPSGKEKLFGKLACFAGRGLDFTLSSMCRKLNAYSSDPVIFNVDLSKRDNDYQLVQGVQYRESINVAKPPKITTRNKSMLNFFWFVLVIIFIIFVASSAVNITEKDKTEPIYIKQKININTGKTGEAPFDPTGELKTYSFD